jgi:hypothetical protein
VSLWKRVMLRLLEWLGGFMSEMRQRLRDEKERADELAARKKACAWVRDGEWAVIARVACEKCRPEWQGQLVRVRRFTTEATSLGEWSIEGWPKGEPGLKEGFICAQGTVLQMSQASEAENDRVRRLVDAQKAGP